MFSYIFHMRTTVELPAFLRQKLVNEAAKRNAKGYSAIIVEALELYFQENDQSRDNNIIKALRGSLNKEQYNEAVAALREGRRNWRM